MRRTSFFGALLVIAVGGILAFGIQSSPKGLNIQLTGLIIMIAGAADLVLRSVIADSPLLSQQTADVAAVVEPEGEPVLDAFGNPIVLAEDPARPPLVVPNVQPTQTLPAVVEPPAEAAPVIQDDVQRHVGPDQVVRQVGDDSTPEELVPVSVLTGRPVRRRRRRLR